MAHLISFSTAKFALAAETPNPINPLAGQGVLRWLRDELARVHYRSSEPDSEDWGWYMNVEGHGAAYLVGASGDGEADGAEIDWTVQVHRRRGLKDKLLGRNQLAADDPLFARIEQLVRADRLIHAIEVDRDA